MRNRYLSAHYRVDKLMHESIARDDDNSLIRLYVYCGQMVLAVVAFGCADQVEGEVGVGEEVLHAVKVFGGVRASAWIEINDYLQLRKLLYWSACDQTDEIQLKHFVLCYP